MFLFTLFEMIGTAAFAISGALLGIRKGLDLFGVAMLAITTAVGGGIIRDVVIGNTPPVAFKAPVYFVISLLSAIFTMFAFNWLNKLNNVIMTFDAIGLGIFTAIGAKLAFQYNINTLYVVVSLALLTGIGGGILRDVFVKEIPVVFRKEIYAVASIIGAIVFYYTRPILAGNTPLYLCAFVTLIIRLLAIRKHIDLPILQKVIEDDTRQEVTK